MCRLPAYLQTEEDRNVGEVSNLADVFVTRHPVYLQLLDYLLTDLSRIPLQAIREKRESEYLRNLFLALKFAGQLEQIRQHWGEILAFRTAHPDATSKLPSLSGRRWNLSAKSGKN